jgi:hypothetical protein
MTENTSLTGWVVEVTTQGELSRSDGRSNYFRALRGAPSFQYFNVAIAAANKAEAATTAHLAEEPPREARAVRMLSSRELASLKLQAGQVAAA